MTQKQLVHIALITSTMLLGEVYQLFHTPYARLRDWFLLSDVQQDIEWYIKDTGDKLCWIIFISVFLMREKRGMFKNILWAFLFYRVADLIAYWLTFSLTTWYYAGIYAVMAGFIAYSSLSIYFKSKCKHK